MPGSILMEGPYLRIFTVEPDSGGMDGILDFVDPNTLHIYFMHMKIEVVS